MSSVYFTCDACGQNSLIDVPCPFCNAKMEMHSDESHFGNADGVGHDQEDGQSISSDGAFGQEFWEV